jgi:hypothetical protein
MPTSAPPLPLPASPPRSFNPAEAGLEQLVGSLVATAACLVARGLGELRRDGQLRMSADTRQQGRELMAALIELRQGTAFELDFERVAKEHGVRALQELCDGAVSQRTINELVAAVLEILASIVRLRLN